MIHAQPFLFVAPFTDTAKQLFELNEKLNKDLGLKLDTMLVSVELWKALCDAKEHPWGMPARLRNDVWVLQNIPWLNFQVIPTLQGPNAIAIGST